MKHKFDYHWTLKDANFTKDKGTVFSCFACGGGSSMGYKLAGFDVIGCNEIDHRMMYAYCQNHNPRFPFLEPIQTFKEKQDLPPELFNLDILDGSPPCSTFSMAGSREDAWGKMKHFREGQAEQVLDTLFFDFIDLAKRLQPKVVVAENVKGLLLGEAKDYVRRIVEAFEEAGYYCQFWLLDAQKWVFHNAVNVCSLCACEKTLHNRSLSPKAFLKKCRESTWSLTNHRFYLVKSPTSRGVKRNQRLSAYCGRIANRATQTKAMHTKCCTAKEATLIKRMFTPTEFARHLRAKKVV